MQQLGKGGEARVFGPLTFKQLTNILSPDLLKPLDSLKQERFIIKVFFSQKKNDVVLLEKMKAIPYPKTVVFPLVYATVPVDQLKPHFKIESENTEVDIQIQLYGGQDAFNFFFESETDHTLSVKNLVEIMEQFQKMLVNCFFWIVYQGLIITDLKLENMVLSIKNDVMDIRFIDLAVSQPKSKSRIITYQLDLLPIQFFTPMFKKSKNFEMKKEKYIRKSKKKYQENDPNRPWVKILHQIHNNIDSFDKVFSYYSSQPLHPLNSPFFLVLYPLLLTILELIVYKVNPINQKEISIVGNIQAFCIKWLKNRGSIFHKKENYENDFNEFLKEMSLCRASI